MSLGARYTCAVCDGFVNLPRNYKGSGRCRCDERLGYPIAPARHVLTDRIVKAGR